MKTKRYIPLRLRISIVVGIILCITTLSLTFFSIFQANQSLNQAQGYTESILGESGIPEDALVFDDESQTEFMVEQSTTLFQNFVLNSFIVMLVVSVIGSAITYFVIARMTNPLDRLNQTILSIHANNLNQSVAVGKHNDEVANLAQSFNQMLAQLQTYLTAQKNFAANAAHELKTPLTTMKSNLQLLAIDTEATLESYEQTSVDLMECVNRMIHIVDELLCLSSQEGVQKQERLVVTQTYESIVSELSQQIVEKELTVDMQSSACVCYGNQKLLTRSIANVIENAIKYSKPQGTIVLASKPTWDGVELCITDDGIGIAEEDLAHVFEPFYRSAHPKHAITGNGLGLAIVKMIIESHHGSIIIESEETKGTCVRIQLPSNK